jgi:hypothetical protein
MNEQEIRDKANQMVQAIHQIWPTTSVPTVIMVMVEVQVKLLRVAGNLNAHEALDALQEVLNHVRDSQPKV